LTALQKSASLCASRENIGSIEGTGYCEYDYTSIRFGNNRSTCWQQHGIHIASRNLRG
jgi:hypothetical protein